MENYSTGYDRFRIIEALCPIRKESNMPIFMLSSSILLGKKVPIRTGEPLYTGKVIDTLKRSVRIGFDEWSEEVLAIVWSYDSPIEVSLCIYGLGSTAEAEIDATPEVLEAYESFNKEKERKSKIDAALKNESDAQARLLVPAIGFPARVVKGKKVPIGTEGIISWASAEGFGTRIGLKDVFGKVHFMDRDNAIRLVTQLEGGSWVDTEQRLLVAPPNRWDRVKIVSGTHEGKEGLVFYQNGMRIGVALTPRKEDGRYRDVIWTEAPSVQITKTGNGHEPL